MRNLRIRMQIPFHGISHQLLRDGLHGRGIGVPSSPKSGFLARNHIDQRTGTTSHGGWSLWNQHKLNVVCL
jgi:hypothetical protein